MIRRATIKDVKAMHRLITEQAGNGQLLPRALSELYSQVRDYLVCAADTTGRLGTATNDRVGLGLPRTPIRGRSACGPMAGGAGSTHIYGAGERWGETATCSSKEAGLEEDSSRLEKHSHDSHTGELVGCGALQIVWEDLAEIRSLAVTTGEQGRGIGTALITQLLADAKQMGVERVFVLTYRPELFERLGFERMDKNLLPHKIWADCIRCTKFPECNEIAMVRSG